MSTLDLQDLIPFKEVSKHWPAPLHVSQPHRWRKDGVRGVKLKAVVVPGCGYCTTKKWLAEFIEASQRNQGSEP